MENRLSVLEATRIPLPRNPFKRHRAVKDLVNDMKMPGVEVKYLRFPLMGRRDLEEYAHGLYWGENIHSQVPPISERMIFGTLRGRIIVHPREEV